MPARSDECSTFSTLKNDDGGDEDDDDQFCTDVMI